MGGEHGTSTDTWQHTAGSSPRGRGTRKSNQCQGVNRRIIPAWAGNTRVLQLRPGRRADHPRVGGEHYVSGIRFVSGAGSSPRGRGTRSPAQELVPFQRIIPAWAGNTPDARRSARRNTDHPRVGGEHRSGRSCISPLSGSSPRGRGTPKLTKADAINVRIIPAWAGNTP